MEKVNHFVLSSLAAPKIYRMFSQNIIYYSYVLAINLSHGIQGVKYEQFTWLQC